MQDNRKLEWCPIAVEHEHGHAGQSKQGRTGCDDGNGTYHVRKVSDVYPPSALHMEIG